MSDDWDHYSLLVEDESASVFVDLGIASDVPISGYAYMGYLRIYMRSPRPDGLSSDEEFDALVDLEQRVEDGITANGAALYVGRNTSSGTRDFYFYARDGAQFEQAATAAMSLFPSYEFDAGSRADAEWDTYCGFLYPSARDLQRIKNRRVCEQLEKHGDDLSKPRNIDHFVYFDEKGAAEAFVGYLKESGFDVSGVRSPDDAIPQYTVEFGRQDRPADIEDVAVPLFEKVTELGGTYDGWGCEVTS